jgi:formaldehyde-activating enzyme involved in methanogenesis
MSEEAKAPVVEKTATLADQQFELITNVINEDLAKDFEKFFDKNQKAASRRINRAMTDLRKVTKSIKLAIKEHKASMVKVTE